MLLQRQDRCTRFAEDTPLAICSTCLKSGGIAYYWHRYTGKILYSRDSHTIDRLNRDNGSPPKLVSTKCLSSQLWNIFSTLSVQAINFNIVYFCGGGDCPSMSGQCPGWHIELRLIIDHLLATSRSFLATKCAKLTLCSHLAISEVFCRFPNWPPQY